MNKNYLFSNPIKLCAILFCVSFLFLGFANYAKATAITSNGTGGGNASATSTWIGGVVPVTGDTIVVANGDTVHWDTGLATAGAGITLGSNSSSVGNAVTINGASSSSYGTFIVDNGATLHLAGKDLTTNTLMLVNRYGQFLPAGGSTIIGDVASDYGSMILNKGIIDAIGNQGAHITWTSPSSAYSWNNSATNEQQTASTAFGYESDKSLSALQLAHGLVSNVAGTGIGSYGNSSLSFSTVTPSGALTTEVPTLAQVTSAGTYWVDYQAGYAIYFDPIQGSRTVTINYKYYTLFNGWGISSTQNTTYNEAVFDYCDFTYMGNSAGANLWVLNLDYKKTTLAGGTRQLAQITNSTFNYDNSLINLNDTYGSSSSDLIHIDNNVFNEAGGNSIYGYLIAIYRSPNSYISISSNQIDTRRNLITASWYITLVNESNFFIQGNTGRMSGLFISINPFPDLLLGAGPNTNPLTNPLANQLSGWGMANDARLAEVMGTSGHQAVLAGNVFDHFERAFNLDGYTTVDSNIFAWFPHHGIMVAPASQDNTFVTGNIIRNNLFYGFPHGNIGDILIGYNKTTAIDNTKIINNTFIGYKGTLNSGAIAMGDSSTGGGDGLASLGTWAITRLEIRNNVSFGSGSGLSKGADNATGRTTIHMLADDNNSNYTATGVPAVTQRTTGLPQYSTFLQGGVEYNSSGSRNIGGVGFYGPSYSSPPGSKSLVYTVNSLGTDETLSWGGGTAVQLVVGSGTASAGANISTNGLIGAYSGSLTDSSKTWSTTASVTGCPVGNWVKITGGTGVGQFRQITTNTATVLTVVPSWTTVPDSSSTYTIYRAEVQLLDTTDSVQLINVTSSGANYSTIPTVNFSSGPATAIAVMGATSGISTPGSGQTDGTYALTANGGGGTGFLGKVIISGGVAKKVVVIANGSGYTSVPAMTMVAAGGTPPIFSNALILVSINITSGGYGYSTAPTISFSSGTATATAYLGSVQAGIYWPSMPTTSQTDAGITYVVNFISGDPMFTNSNDLYGASAPTGYAPTLGSSLIGTGSPINAPNKDMLGNSWVGGTTPDIGALAASAGSAPAPTFSSATTNTAGTIVTITFSKAMSNPSTHYAEFTVNNGSSNLVTVATLEGDTTKIDLTVTTPILHGQTVTVSYSGTDVTSTDTGVLASFSNQSVTNNSPTTISATAIDGVTPPVTGGTPVTTVTAGAGYTGTISWNTNPTTFAQSTIYTATITLTPATGYTLHGVTTNQFTIVGATSVTNSSNSGTITAVFPMTASSAKAITAFSFAGLNPAVTGTITEGSYTIALTVPFGTAVTALVPTITITGSSVSPNTGVTANFTSPQTYTVIAANSTTQAYVVTVTVAANTEVPVTPTPAVVTSSGSGGNGLGFALQNLLPITTRQVNNSVEIQRLQTIIENLKIQIQDLISKKMGPKFTKTLRINDADLQVKQLQHFLNTHNFKVVETGKGSLNNETTKFGSATKNALKKFQQAKGLKVTGIFDEATRKIINEL